MQMSKRKTCELLVDHLDVINVRDIKLQLEGSPKLLGHLLKTLATIDPKLLKNKEHKANPEEVPLIADQTMSPYEAAERITEIYNKYNPSHLQLALSLIDKYKGREAELVQTMIDKYEVRLFRKPRIYWVFRKCFVLRPHWPLPGILMEMGFTDFFFFSSFFFSSWFVPAMPSLPRNRKPLLRVRVGENPDW
jgi:hypothetical protein